MNSRILKIGPVRATRAAVTLAIAILGGGVLITSGQAAEAKSRIEIAAGPAGQTLKEFVDQTGLQLLFDFEAVKGLTTRAVSGELGSKEALQRMLAGTGLSFEFVNERTVTVTAGSGRSRTAEDVSQAEREGSASAMRLGEAGSSSRSQDSDPAQAAGDSSGVKLEEVVVTAQKRKEVLKDVPISISVLNGAELDRSNLSVLEELSRVQGFDFVTNGGGATTVSVRGVSAVSAFTGTSTVGFYLDSVPFGFVRESFSPDSDAYDLERIEALRGPQGTLYGVTAVNGVVRVLTKDADLNEFQMKLRASGSTTQGGADGYRGDFAVNVPIVTGKVAARAVAGYEKVGGWIDGPVGKNINGGEKVNLRLKVNAQPTDDLSLGLLVWHSRSNFDGRAVGHEDMTNGIVVPEPNAENYDIYGLKLAYQFSDFSLSSASSYMDDQDNLTVGLGDLPISLFTGFGSKLFAQEINLLSTGEGPWKWTLGGIYRDVRDATAQNFSIPLLPNPQGSLYYDYSKSFAIFGELTRLLWDGRWALTGGLRYFDDKGRNQEIFNPTSPVNAGLATTPNGHFHNVSPRVVLAWHPGKQLMAYASYAEGFRSGFAQASFVEHEAPGFPAVDSDNLVNYELGVKGSTPQGLMTFEAASFFMNWQDIQQQLLVVTPTLPNGINVVINSGSASGVGAEFGLGFHPLSGLDLGVNYTWNDLGFDRDVTTGPSSLVLIHKGGRPAGSAKNIAGAWIGYDFPLAGAYRARFSGQINYASARLTRSLLDGVGGQDLNGDSLLTSRASFAVASPANWTATLFVDNLNNEKATPDVLGGDPVQGEYRIRPRTIGLQFEYRL